MNKATREAIFRRLRDANPEPTTELVYHSTFELLIAVMLSAQSTDKGVNKATAKLFPVANTPESIFALGEEGLKTYIKTIGLFNSKAKNIIATCAILIAQHQSTVPQQRAALEALPGVGRKTANVVRAVAFGIPSFAVDTHVERVSKRLGLAKPQDSVVKVEAKLKRKIDRSSWIQAHHTFIFFGRYMCTARNPKCDNCPFVSICKKDRYK